MANNPYVNKVQYGNTVLIDLTSDTVTADKMMQGYTAHDNTGALITGTIEITPYYMWKDSDRYVHISSSEHSGYKINVSSVEEHLIWTTIYQATISNWDALEHCYDYVADVALGLVYGGIYRVTYDNTVYNVVCPVGISRLGSDVYGWDGTSTLEYPFGIEDGGSQTFIDVTTGGTHTFIIEYAG